MLILYRKSGEGIQVRNRTTGELFDFDFLFNKSPINYYRINGETVEKNEKASFYLDSNREIMCMVIYTDSSIRVGIDAPRNFQIRRKEIPFK